MTAMVLLSEWNKSQIEFWRPIQGFEGYDVSSFGRARSWWRRGGNLRGYVIRRDMPPLVLRFTVHRQGYLEATLYRKRSPRSIKKVHRLVAEAFIANSQSLPQVNHLTGLKSDCRVGGLEWVTQSGNQQHAVSVGLKTAPSGIGRRLSLTEQSALYDKVVSGVPRTILAKEYGISRPTVEQAFLRERQLRRD